MTAAAVVAAGGWYVQLLPFASDEATAQLQENLQALSSRSPTTMVREGLGAEGMLELLMAGLDMQVKATPRRRRAPYEATAPPSRSAVHFASSPS
eukprot:3108383-Prymnesium_polylepis.1